MATTIIVIALVFAAAAFWFARDGVPLPKQFRSRLCQGAGWRRAFPSMPKEDIHAFLSIFVAAFSFHERQGLKFGPSDVILDVYRAMYPHEWQPDGLELETLAASIEKRYGVEFSGLWSERLTLGELFARVHADPPCPNA